MSTEKHLFKHLHHEYLPSSEDETILSKIKLKAERDAAACLSKKLPAMWQRLGERVGSESKGNVYEQYRLLEEEIKMFEDVCDAFCLWLCMNSPAIEDGNNFGVGIQQDVLGLLSRELQSCLTFNSDWIKYLSTVTELVTKR